jgi:hypothetical protein
MSILGMVALASMHAQIAMPVLWLSPNGNVEVAGKPIKARMTNGAARIRLNNGYAYDFNGTRGAILVPDMAELHLTKSITVSLWINLRSYVNDGPGAQILFRGDDRSGVDPYTLVIHSNGTINFGIQDEDHQGMSVTGEIPLNRWMNVLGSYNGENGELKLWLNNECVAYSRTSKRPFANLDPAWAPGIGIGNVQNDTGPHNQPLNGMVADLRLYDRVYEPEDISSLFQPWDNPPAAKRLTVH